MGLIHLIPRLFRVDREVRQHPPFLFRQGFHAGSEAANSGRLGRALVELRTRPLFFCDGRGCLWQASGAHRRVNATGYTSRHGGFRRRRTPRAFLRRAARSEGHELQPGARRDRLPARTVRLREDDGAALSCRVRSDRRRVDRPWRSHRVASGVLDPTGATGCGHGVPGFCVVSASERRAKCRVRPAQAVG